MLYAFSCVYQNIYIYIYVILMVSTVLPAETDLFLLSYRL